MYGKGISGPLPGTIADVASLASDFAFAQEAFARVAQEVLDDTVRRALWDAGIVAYRRGFTGGRGFLQQHRGRTKISPDAVAALEPPMQELHEAILDEANRHIAHRVDDREQVTVTLLLRNPLLGQVLEGVAVLHARYIGPFPERAAAASSLAGTLQAAMTVELERLKQTLLESAQRSDIAALYEGAVPMDGNHGSE